MAQVKQTHGGRTQTKSTHSRPRQGEAPKVDKRHKMSPEAWAESGDWVRVKSSNVAAIAYDHPRRIMRVRFIGGGEYEYYHIHLLMAKNFFKSASMGRFVWKLRRAHYEYKRVA